jgi:hypothetical protein
MGKTRVREREKEKGEKGEADVWGKEKERQKD